MGIRGRRLLERKASRQPANTELGTRVADKAVPLAAVADSTVKLAPFFYNGSEQQGEEVKGSQR